MGSRLVEWEEPIKKHEEANNLEAMLMPEHWAVLEMILPILEPFMHTQTLLEGRKYVTGSLVVPFIHDLRDNLESAMLDLEIAPPSNDADVNKARAAVMPCVKALHKDFINRWGDGSDILTYKEGPRRQPRGFKSVQVLATALDPRTKMLYGNSDDQHADVWKLVQTEGRAGNPPREELHGRRVAAVHSGFHVFRWVGGSTRKCPRHGGFIAAAQSAGQAPTRQTNSGADDSTTSLIVNSVRLEGEAFEAAVGLQMYKEEEKDPGAGGASDDSKDEDDSEEKDDSEENQDERKSRRVSLDPLDWWRVKSADFPHLVILARRVLAIPATQVESERLFSCTGKIVSKNRNKLASSTVELLVLLRHSWKIVEEWEASYAAAAKGVTGGST